MARFRIRIGRLYKVAPQFADYLIRLMAAANDFITILTSMDSLPEPKTDTERLQTMGQRVYFFRLACGHLHEAIQVLKELPRKCPEIVRQAPPEFGENFNEIATSIFPLEGSLDRLRNNAIFHYGNEMFKVLREWGEDAEGEVVSGMKPAEERYGVADDAFSRALSRIFGFPDDREESNRAFERLIPKIATAQVALIGCVRALLATARRICPEAVTVVPADEQAGQQRRENE